MEQLSSRVKRSLSLLFRELGVSSFHGPLHYLGVLQKVTKNEDIGLEEARKKAQCNPEKPKAE